MIYFEASVRRRALYVSLCCFGLIALFIPLVSANKGYDKEENPTNVFRGYCVPLKFKQELGLCQNLEGNPRVCAASLDSQNPLSAGSWYANEVNEKRAPHNQKALIFGDQAFQKLQLFFTNWACKQLGDDVRQRTDLSEEEKQEAACNFVWRRDQEIQKPGSPQPDEPWGRFTYDPPGDDNETTFIFKGMPKDQCAFDYDCREFNDPGQVYTCCDYCEQYFFKYCDAKYEDIFKFCMERVHCVCNSVTKACAKPNLDRGFSEVFPDGFLYPVFGAPCSPAPSLSSLAAAAAALSAALALLLPARYAA
eukprot:CAMPEP_0181299146 /NCGR_PEP_ID=MMETSP1101-20121128/6178_1 /TAXON_ID=46948 /ORGANISM="Rhodomonas abbreviata, Strain Caron Lab Isolate" /LENGTH=306 /DNA_ID=CAMNT_0023404251 /DNA_START=24 /DNA_END=944 /DNA_ORIENTATION=-